MLKQTDGIGLKTGKNIWPKERCKMRLAGEQLGVLTNVPRVSRLNFMGITKIIHRNWKLCGSATIAIYGSTASTAFFRGARKVIHGKGELVCLESKRR